MKFFNELNLLESELSASRETMHVIHVVNELYAEWKKTGRRKNAVDIITTTANKLSTIDPLIVDRVHDATRVKIVALLIRCFDIPHWKNISEKEKIFKKLINLVKVLETSSGNVDSGGNLREVIMTRLSSSVCYNSDNPTIFVAYEPTISDAYLRYLFGKNVPEVTYRVQSLMMPADFESLVTTLRLNHEKVSIKHNSKINP